MVRQLRVLCILKYNGKTIGIEAIDRQEGTKVRVRTEDLIKYRNNIRLENAIITSNGHVRALKGNLDQKDIAKEERRINRKNIMVLYHGSKFGIQGEIKHTESRVTCDFGQGFYTGDNMKQAQMLILHEKGGKLYTIEADMKGLSVYRFKDPVLWALYVAYNREKIDRKKYAKLVERLSEIDKNDVVVGPIADDKMHEAYSRFFDNAITDKCLIECLKYIDYGNQYVFKSDEACRRLRVIKCENMQSFNVSELKKEKKHMIGHIEADIDRIRESFLRKGKYFNEVLAKYNK